MKRKYCRKKDQKKKERETKKETVISIIKAESLLKVNDQMCNHTTLYSTSQLELTHSFQAPFPTCLSYFALRGNCPN